MKLFFLIPILLGSFAHAEIEKNGVHAHGSHSECPLPQSPQDVVACAQVESPASKRSRLAVDEALALNGVAKQFANPDLDLQSGFGKLGDEKRSEIQLGFRQPIDWGGQRGARIKTASAEQKRIIAAQQETQANVIIETVLKLHRLRQLTEETKSIAETSDALTKIVQQQKSRAVLTPEQEGALAVYQMALADSKIRASEIYEEERSLEHFFHVSTGHSLAEINPVLPPSPRDWPNVSESPEKSISPGLNVAIADQEFTAANREMASAISWPALRLGPQITFVREGPRSDTLLGLSLMMDLPIFNWNSGGRAYAEKSVGRADAVVGLVQEEEGHERAEQLKLYQNTLEVLKASPNLAQIEALHSKNQKLAGRGFIAGSLLIESYRQKNDLIKGRNSRELKAIEALWKIYKFDGRIFEEKI